MYAPKLSGRCKISAVFFNVTEADDRDMSCVVSSLVQVMCDPHCRTQHGFQSLVQKEWVMAGHRFYSRVNYHRDNDKEEVRGCFFVFVRLTLQK